MGKGHTFALIAARFRTAKISVFMIFGSTGGFRGLSTSSLVKYEVFGAGVKSFDDVSEFDMVGLVHLRRLFEHDAISRGTSSPPETIVLPSIRNPSCDPAHFEPNEFCAIPTTKHLTPDAFFIGSWYTDDLPLEVLPTE
jgi:hypothetical protein